VGEGQLKSEVQFFEGIKNTRYRPTLQTEAYPTVCGVVWLQVAMWYYEPCREGFQ